MSKTGIASLATEPVNLTQELDSGIIAIRQVKTVGYGVDKYTGKLLSLIGFLYVLQAKKIKLGSSWRMIVIVHFD